MNSFNWAVVFFLFVVGALYAAAQLGPKRTQPETQQQYYQRLAEQYNKPVEEVEASHLRTKKWLRERGLVE